MVHDPSREPEQSGTGTSTDQPPSPMRTPEEGLPVEVMS